MLVDLIEDAKASLIASPDPCLVTCELTWIPFLKLVVASSLQAVPPTGARENLILYRLIKC